jgi:hypothetical protein
MNIPVHKYTKRNKIQNLKFNQSWKFYKAVIIKGVINRYRYVTP